MTEALIYIGSVVRAEVSTSAWETLSRLGVNDIVHLITQLYDGGAVAIGGYSLLHDKLSFAGSFSQNGSIHEVLRRLSFDELNALTRSAISPFKINRKVYNQEPLPIQLINMPG